MNITIERELLDEVVELFDNAITARYPHEILRDLRAALAAPATAPEPLKARPDFIAGYDAGMADAKRMQMAAALEYQRQLVDVQVRSAPATAPESGVMTEIDYNDDDALRFVQRVLESDAPLSDIRDARNMVVEIRTRVLKARASKPATAPEPICTKCGDVITAHDPGLCGCCLSTRDATSPEQKDRPINCGTGHCSCIECVMLFNAEAKGPRSGPESKDRKTWMHAGDYLGGGY